jgi:glycosyltransferase involved in cell wall biosynthesis
LKYNLVVIKPSKRLKKVQPDLSVVVLCYKSGELAQSFYQKLIKSLTPLVPNYEVILVANYSDLSDQTPIIVKQLAKTFPRTVALTRKKQGMMGWDMRSGLSKATGKYVAVIDGDNQFKPELIVKVYKKMLKTQADVVKTKRVRRDDGLFRRFISLGFNTLFVVLFGLNNFSDVNSKPKMFKKTALEAMTLHDNGWFIDAEIMLNAKKLGLTTAEVPVHFYQNKYRESFVGYSAIIEILVKLLSYKLKDLRESVYDFGNRRDWLYWPKIAQSAQ